MLLMRFRRRCFTRSLLFERFFNSLHWISDWQALLSDSGFGCATCCCV
jgi:hypothetical protein